MSAFRSSGALCVILLDYIRPLADVDAQMNAHVAWLEAAFSGRAFLLGGRRGPRTGGVIVARGTREDVEAIAATDPFVTSGVATAQVVAFDARFAAAAVREWLA